MKYKKLLKRLLIVVVVLLVFSVVVSWTIFANMTVGAIRNVKEYPKAEQADTIISIPTNDMIQLYGYQKFSTLDTTYGTIIFLHGKGSNADYSFALADAVTQRGFDMLAYDSRAHARSEGEYCTYGFYEKMDVSSVINYIHQQKPGHRIGVWGQSYGGAVGLQALEYDERIDFGIIESTFSSLHQVVFDYGQRLFKIPFRYMTNIALIRAGNIANFDAKEVAPIESVKNIEQPMLMIHGDEDIHIPFENGKALFEGLASEQKQFLKIEGADHLNVKQVGGELYYNTIFAFLEKNR